MPGIGKRTAERIIVELREKIAGELEGDGDGITVTKAGEEDPRSMAREGLLNLGYTPPEAERLLDRADGESAEELRPVGAAQRVRGQGGMRSSIEPGKGIRTPDADARSRIHDARAVGADDDFDRSLRPPTLDDFVGQVQVTDQLGIFIEAARRREEAARPRAARRARPGSARPRSPTSSPRSCQAPLVQTAGPALERKADIAAFLTGLEPGSVFFIDEIHRLGRAVEETLYPAMEDRRCRSCSARGPGRGPSRSTCRPSR